MKTENILTIEESGENRINLVRDRLFWQAWNRSAFLFATHIKSYQVHKRFVQKVAQDVAWLGFPASALRAIQKIAEEKGFSFEQKSGDHIVIGNVMQTSGYEKWWNGIVKSKPAPAAPAEPKANSLLPAYKTAYDLCLHIHRVTVKMPREFRYELGARVRNYATDIVEMLHLSVNTAHKSPDCAFLVHRLRIVLRLLKDLHQISIEQWGFLNQQIENLLNLLRAEFCNANPRIAGATRTTVQQPAPTYGNAGEHTEFSAEFS
ncbi:MAG: four helix bundle protein [Fibromonadaceae bacterium]|jgi:hypothetical protein|nr:four helix bundle protein [Fibromonadaceae bacterium]